MMMGKMMKELSSSIVGTESRQLPVGLAQEVEQVDWNRKLASSITGSS